MHVAFTLSLVQLGLCSGSIHEVEAAIDWPSRILICLHWLAGVSACQPSCHCHSSQERLLFHLFLLVSFCFLCMCAVFVCVTLVLSSTDPILSSFLSSFILSLFLVFFLSLSFFSSLLHLLSSLLQVIFKLSWSQGTVNTAWFLQVCVLCVCVRKEKRWIEKEREKRRDREIDSQNWEVHLRCENVPGKL